MDASWLMTSRVEGDSLADIVVSHACTELRREISLIMIRAADCRWTLKILFAKISA
jgi:hypothetical protein